MVMPGTTVTTPIPPNKNLYNGGSEWQNDYANNQPDYYQTFYRNYDAALGRFAGVDPEPEGSESITPYQYAGNNPIVGNDPFGNKPLQDDYEETNLNLLAMGIAQNGGGGFPGGDGYVNFNDYGNGFQPFQAQWDYEDKAAGLPPGYINIYHAGDGSIWDPHSGISASSIMSNLTYYAQNGITDQVAGNINLSQVTISSWNQLNSAIQAEAYQTNFYSYSNSDNHGSANQGGPGGENAPNSAWTMRDNNVNWRTLWYEYRTGTGPTYSGFGANHPMTKDLKNSFIVQQAIARFLLNGGKEPLINFQARFYGPIGPIMSETMTEQFLGSARVSIFPSQLGYIFVVTNTTDKNSLGVHIADSFPRDPNAATPYGTIYQKFMWISK
jgi:RHS repeat-associated protein